MKKLLFILSIILSFAASGQIYYNQSLWQDFTGKIKTHRFVPPTDTLSTADTLSFAIVNSDIYQKQNHWIKIVSAGAVPITAGYGLSGTTTFKVDTSFNGLISWKENKRKLDSLAALITAGAYINPMTTQYDMIKAGASGVQQRLPGNATTIGKILRSIGDGTNVTSLDWAPESKYIPGAGEAAGWNVVAVGNGRDLTSVPNSLGCTRLLGPVTVTKVSALTYYVSAVDYLIGCQVYNWLGGNVSLGVGTADPNEFRSDLIIFNIGGADTLKGENSTGGVGSAPVYDPATEIPVTTIRIDEDNTDDSQVGLTIIKNETYASGDWYWSGPATFDSLYTGVTPYNGTYSMRLFGATNGQYVQLNSRFGVMQSKAVTNNIIIYAKNITAFPAGKNLTIRLMRNGVQVPGTAAVDLSTKGFAKTNVGSIWQTLNISTSDFGGEDAYNGIRITSTGNTGTINTLFDYWTLQNGINIISPGGGAYRYGLEDNNYTLNRFSYLNNFSHQFSGINEYILTANAGSSTNDFFVLKKADGSNLMYASTVDNSVHFSQLFIGANLFASAAAFNFLNGALLNIATGAKVQVQQQPLDFYRNYLSAGSEPYLITRFSNDTISAGGFLDSTQTIVIQTDFVNAANGRRSPKHELYGDGKIKIFNGPNPASAPVGGAYIWANGGEMKVEDASGNATPISPHNFDFIPEGPSDPMAWSHTTMNGNRFVSADMFKALRTIENLAKEVEELKAKVYKLTGSTYKPRKKTKLIYTGKIKK